MTALLDARVTELLGAVLLHSLWQGAVIGAVAALVLAFLRRPVDRYRVACVSLAALLVWPGVTAVRLASDPPTPVPAATAAANLNVPAALSSVAPPLVVGGSPEAPAADSHQPSGVTPESERGSSAITSLEGRLAPVLTLFWLVGVLAGLARLGIGLTLVARLRRTGTVASSQVVELAREVAGRLGLRLRVAILETTRASSPVVVGVLRPTLLLPAGLAPSLPPAQLEAVLAHELAHVLRRDYLVNLLQRLTETLMFHHPATWWLSAVARTERENLCDDAAVRSVGGDPRPLAEALAALASARGNTPLVSVGAADGPLVSRVRRLVAGGDRPRRGAALSLQASKPALLLTLLAVMAPFVAQPLAGAQASATDADELVHEAPLPFALRYGNHFDLGGAPFQLLYLHVDLEPRMVASIEPATVRVLDAEGELLYAEEMTSRERMGGWPVEASRAAAVEVITAAGSWTVPLEVEAAAEGFGAVQAVRVVQDDDEALLTWDAVPGAAAYRVILLPEGPGFATLLYSSEATVSLAGLEAGPYDVKLEVYSRNPSTPGQVLTMDYATSSDLGSVEVPPTDVSDSARGAVEGRVMMGSLPVAGAGVNIRPSSGQGGPVLPAHTAVTDSEGYYRYENVVPGIYSVNAVMQPPSALVQFGVPYMVESTSFSVAADRTAKPPDLYLVQRIAPLGRLRAGTANPGDVVLEWDQVPSADRYIVLIYERVVRTEPWESGVLLASHSLSDTSVTVTLEPQSVYEVTIEAFDADGVRVGELLAELRTVPGP